MMELLFAACISGSPTDCEEKSLIYTDITTMSCMMQAQPQLAQWVETHPEWRIASWKCRLPGKGRSV
jgi:hypothetical protein